MSTFTPDNLIAGSEIVDDWGTLIASAGALSRGTVLGRVTKGTVAAAAAAGAGEAGANTGNGTCTIDATTPKLSGAKPGTYHVGIIRVAVAGVATTPAVPAQLAIGGLYDPDGVLIDTFEIGANGGTATTVANQVKFAIIQGSTGFAITDGFDIVIAAGSGSLKIVNSANVDGSEAPYAVLLESVADAAATQPAVVALAGEFREVALVFGGSDTIATHRDALRALGIYAKKSTAA